MNKELIQKFLNKACYDGQDQYELEDWLNVEKFAELLVKECASVNYNSPFQDGEFHAREVLEHFGVQE